MGGFENPIVGGTALRIPAIQSPDYSAGSTGWIIKIDGSAEFNNLTVRGEFVGTNFIINSAGVFLYSGTPASGNLIGSWASTSGTDGFGNAYLGGLTVYATDGSILQIEAGAGASEYFTPQDVATMTWNRGVITTTIGAGNHPGLSIGSPAEDSNPQSATIDLFGGSSASSATSILMGADRVNFSSDVEITGKITTYDTFTTYTPAITGDGGATYTTKTGYWTSIGDMIYFVANVLVNGAGSGTTPITITAPTNIDRTLRQSVPANGDAMTGNSGSLTALALTGGSGAVFDRVRNSTGGNLTGASLQANAFLTVEGWYRRG